MKVYWDSKTGIFEWQDRDDKISSPSFKNVFFKQSKGFLIYHF